MTLINKAFAKRIIPVSSFGGTLAQPPKATMEQFLRAYGEIGWFHAVVSFIARGVAEVDWTLNRVTDGEVEEITGPHPLKTLLNSPNPFQSGHDLMELTQIYEDITGEGYWHLDYNEGKYELWTFPPHRIKVAISNKEYITGYVFMSGEGEVPLPKEDIIPFITPNPLTPWRGLSAAQAIGIELDTLTYANQTNRFYFYNGATMGLVISYPSDVSQEEYNRLKEQFNADHRGYGRAHRVTILSGSAGGAPTITQAGQSFGTRDMDFVNMLKNSRDAILGGYGIPYSQLGGAEVNTRATAEAAQVDVARRVLRPRLFKKRETLNRLLVPRFITKEMPQTAYGLQKALRESYGYWTIDADKRVYEIKARLNIEGSVTDSDNMKSVWKAVEKSTKLEFDFANPVPKDVIQNATIAGTLYQQGISTLNESREMVELDPVDEGEEFYHAPAPASPFGFGGNERQTQEDQDTSTQEDKVKGIRDPKVKSFFDTEEKAVEYWRKQDKQAQSFEPKFVTAMQGVFDATLKEVLANCQSGINRDSKLFDLVGFHENYEKAITPVMTECILTAVKSGRELITPSNPHKGFIQFLSPFILKWLKTRITWAANEVGDETEKLLRQVLISGFEQGQGIPTIAKRIREIPGFADQTRSERIARTETLMSHNQGTMEGYKQSGFVRKVQWMTARDGRTCKICAPMEGMVFDIDDFPTPPASSHPSCRCCPGPVVEMF